MTESSPPPRAAFDSAFARWRSEITCRPTIGEYPVYDDHLYRWLLEDSGRIAAYRGAIQRAAPRRRVVDLGTGASAPLAIMCAEAGASHVDAIEVMPASAEAARVHIAKLGLSDRITVHCGPSTEIEPAEPADLCVSEVIGMIGSAEGAVGSLLNARRLLKPDGRMLPKRCITWFAPASVVEAPYRNAACTAVADHYAQRIKQSVGRDFTLSRIVTFNFPESHLLAEKHIFEDLRFDTREIAGDAGEVVFDITRSGQLGGFVLWIELHVDEEHVICSWRGSSWAPVFLAMAPVAVQPGDRLNVSLTRFIHRAGENPSYSIIGHVARAGRPVAVVEIVSLYAWP
ncbi:hypothetical protein GG804_18505 [Sphingomonas histidinilytica]|uniref:class I SAM-dependent methyltransferase n=1 Tax=Rhizorhabdus histidinilytica TaxID=439228 RepID=UPI001ADD1714|nr:class I SAM-dependent methyltransferase [Rhizorhabdus histidinilytica]MBO9378765.1 hypothetical protein [Rhizorhabdus histidinilytica]